MRRDVFHAIADPTRRAIIILLAVKSMTPNALAEHFSISRQAVSKHLRVLNECEILKANQKGRELHYQLNQEKINEVDKWISQLKALFANRFEQLDQVLYQLKNNQK